MTDFTIDPYDFLHTTPKTPGPGSSKPVDRPAEHRPIETPPADSDSGFSPLPSAPFFTPLSSLVPGLVPSSSGHRTPPPSSSPSSSFSNANPAPATTSNSRVPPHHLEAERSVLAAILVQNDLIDQISDTGLAPKDFYLESHQKLFEICVTLHQRREAVDLITLSAALKDRGLYEAIGGAPMLTQLFRDEFNTPHVIHYAKIIREKAILRRTIEICSQIVGSAYQGVENIEAFLDQAETQLLAVSESTLTKSFVDIRSVILNNVEMIETMAIQNKDVTGLSTGFKDFDELTAGLQPGQVVVIAARPGMGKTSWFLSALQHTAVHDQSVVGLFSLEMSKEEMGFRLLSGLARLDSKNLRIGRLSDRDWRRLTESADLLSRSKIFIDDSPGLSVMDIRARCRRLLASEKKIDLIVIDYLQLMRGSKGFQKNDSREREISDISRGLKELAKELKVPIIALSQLNRSVESRTDKRPNLSDLRESGAIEQDADMVCFIYRDEVYNKETPDKGVAEFIIGKNRSGPTETVRLAWIGQYTLFENLTGESGGGQAVPFRPEKGDSHRS